MLRASVEAALASISKTRVAVVGDVILDEFVWGEVTRISPDAPVPVVEVRRRSSAIGGAGNVANNIVAAGGSAHVFGVVGADASGEVVRALLRDAGIDDSGIVGEKGRPTTVKTRVVARGQHVLRFDQEVSAPLQAATREHILSALAQLLPSCGAVIVSDYAKGVIDAELVPEIARLAATAGSGGRAVPILVDPKVADVSRYTGCFMITPNLREAEVAAGRKIATDADLAAAAARIRASSGAPWVLITRGDRGMALSGPDGSLEHIPARAREVYDVTGAGDTVMAYLGAGVAAGLPALEAASIANLAAGVGVGKVGTATVGPVEVLASEAGSRNAASKIVDLAGAAARAGYERSIGRKVVFTNGCFDLLHAGHVHLLERARALGDFLVVAINSDASVTRLKGEGRPVLSAEDRVKVLSALDAVDLVLVFDEDTPIAAIRKVRPDVLVKGGDYSRETIVGHDFVDGYGGCVETIPLAQGRSTTGLIEAINRADRTGIKGPLPKPERARRNHGE